jgi:hypothetical protein
MIASEPYRLGEVLNDGGDTIEGIRPLFRIGPIAVPKPG